MGGLTDERYPAGNIEEVLSEYFGETMLSEALTDIIVPACELQRRDPIFFKNMFLDGMSDSVHYRLTQLLPAHSGGRRRYYRFQTPLTFGSDNLDDASRTNIRALKLLAQDLIHAEAPALDELCAQLTGVSA